MDHGSLYTNTAAWVNHTLSPDLGSFGFLIKLQRGAQAFIAEVMNNVKVYSIKLNIKFLELVSQ
jgi:hypothetical protein